MHDDHGAFLLGTDRWIGVDTMGHLTWWRGFSVGALQTSQAILRLHRSSPRGPTEDNERTLISLEKLAPFAALVMVAQAVGVHSANTMLG